MHTFIVFTTSWLAEHVCLIDAYILSVVIADTWTHSSWWCCSWYEDDVLALVLTTNYYMSLLVGWCFGQSQQYAGSPSWRDCGWGLYYVLHWYCLMYGFPLCVLPRGCLVAGLWVVAGLWMRNVLCRTLVLSHVWISAMYWVSLVTVTYTNKRHVFTGGVLSWSLPTISQSSIDAVYFFLI